MDDFIKALLDNKCAAEFTPFQRELIEIWLRRAFVAGEMAQIERTREVLERKHA